MSTPRTMPPLAAAPLQADHLMVASHRGPLESSLSHENERKHRPGSSGLVTALLETGHRRKVTWAAMAMTEGDRCLVHRTAGQQAAEQRRVRKGGQA